MDVDFTMGPAAHGKWAITFRGAVVNLFATKAAAEAELDRINREISHQKVAPL